MINSTLVASLLLTVSCGKVQCGVNASIHPATFITLLYIDVISAVPLLRLITIACFWATDIKTC